MKNKFFIFFCFIVVMMGVSQHSFAQKENDQVALDSSAEATLNDKSDEEYSDTVLKMASLNYDSVVKWKESRGFVYMNYLDSLLRKKTGLKADTVTIDQTGKIRQVLRSPDNSGINKFLNSLPLKIFFWALAIFFIGFIFYKLFFENGIFNKVKNKSVETENEDNPFILAAFSEYDILIHEAEAKNNFNLSTRYLYLQTLKTLSDKGFINFSPEKTNNEYMNEMESQSHQHRFASLTRNYEYTWYGKFLIDRFQYQKLKDEFVEFSKNL